MPALSFQGEWLNALLSGGKQQTTRPRTDRFKVGDVCHIYNQQRRRILDKQVRRMTGIGTTAMADRVNNPRYYYDPKCPVVKGSRIGDMPSYYAHFLGKVEIMRVYDIRPCRMTVDELEAWARADGFRNFVDADVWFTKQYDEYWIDLKWTVIRWNGWMVRYFKAEGED